MVVGFLIRHFLYRHRFSKSIPILEFHCLDDPPPIATIPINHFLGPPACDCSIRVRCQPSGLVLNPPASLCCAQNSPTSKPVTERDPPLLPESHVCPFCHGSGLCHRCGGVGSHERAHREPQPLSRLRGNR